MALVAVFAFYYANIGFFYHSHTINGTTIVHSHIFNKTNAQTSTHSNSELRLISILSIFQSLQANVCSVSLSVFLLLQVFILPSFEKRIISNPVACVSLRAPPSLF
jgi:hypothetical protein